MNIQLPALPYDYNSLEPHIDEQTMRIHHTKHHQGYIDKLNAVLEKHSVEATNESEIISMMKKFSSLDYSEEDKTTFRNNGGGYLNHNLFWRIMGPEKEVDEELQSNIKSEFGSVENFKDEFSNASTTRFGSGWAWLVDSEGELKIYSTPNQDSPYFNGDTPLIGLDVWEHAYYLKYQNMRADYIKNWWSVLKILE